MSGPSVKLEKVGDFRGGPGAWFATITHEGGYVEEYYYPFVGGEWLDCTRQTMGYCDFRAGSDRSRAWRRIRRLHTEVTA